MSNICLITALPVEARPLVAHFRLSSVAHRYLRLYRGEHCILLQCGVGKLNAAAATAAMLEYCPQVNAIVNVGIAGADQPLGTVVIAHAIKDEGSGRQWFPHLPAKRKLADAASIDVLTVDSARTNYDKQTAFDMEASGVALAASKRIDMAFVHSVKVVSDNGESPIDAISLSSVTTGMEKTFNVVENLIDTLPFDTQAKNQTIDHCVNELTKRIHYTETEKHKLTRLLQRLQATQGHIPSADDLAGHSNAKKIRIQLQQNLDNTPVRY